MERFTNSPPKSASGGLREGCGLLVNSAALRLRDTRPVQILRAHWLASVNLLSVSSAVSIVPLLCLLCSFHLSSAPDGFP